MLCGHGACCEGYSDERVALMSADNDSRMILRCLRTVRDTCNVAR